MQLTDFSEQVMTAELAQETLSQGRHPKTWWGYMNVASALNTVGQQEAAEKMARKAVALEENCGTLMNLAFILHTKGDYVGALPMAKRAYEADRDNKFAGFLYAEMLLRFERWDEGWELYERHFWNTQWGKFKLAFPIWTGQDLAGKRIGVPSFEGFGDTIMFFRWVQLLHQLGAEVVFYCKDQIAPLFEGHPWVYEVRRIVDNEVYFGMEHFDYFLPLVALPNHFNVSVKPFPWPGPYIKPRLSYRLEPTLKRRGLPLVGYCTKAGEVTAAFSTRTLSAEQKARLLYCDTVEWVSLEYGEQPLIKDWADTAAIIHELDYVVSVDTGVAHLAGAMGKPVNVIVPGGLGAAWWLRERTDSPWYPTARVFRNRGVGLDNAVDAVCKALSKS